MTERSLFHLIERMDEKLKEYMSEEEHAKFSAEIAKEAFRINVDGLPDGEFKNFTLENFDKIVGDSK